MDTHPYNAPLAYVTPTSDMQIKVSMFVDHNGKIYLPYLHEWNPVSDINSNVFIVILQIHQIIIKKISFLDSSHHLIYSVLFK